MNEPGAPRRRSCYAGSLGGCGGRLSLEHYISREVLRQIQNLGGPFKISGFPRLSNAAAELPLHTLQARILCRDHNAALSPLDAEAGRLFAALVRANEALPADLASISVDGHLIERWMIKVLVGLIASGNLDLHGQQVRENPQRAVLPILFGQQPFPDACGLWLIEDDNGTEVLEFAPILNQDGGKICGIRLGILGLVFLVNLRRGRLDDTHARFRPSRIVLEESVQIDLRWTGPPRDEAVEMRRVRH